MTDNLALQTGRTLIEWYPVLDATGLEKHTALMDFLKREHGVSHGFANMIALGYRSRGVSQEADDLVEAQYSGAKSALRPIHDRLVEIVRGFGDDVEIAPKKTEGVAAAQTAVRAHRAGEREARAAGRAVEGRTRDGSAAGLGLRCARTR